MFKDLKGIEKGREERKRDETILERIIALQEVLSKLDFKEYENTKNPELLIHKKICAMIRKELPVYNEKDLQSFIHARANYDGEMPGIYAGCLLDVLAERNKEQGKKTRFQIDGQGNRYDWLFGLSKNISELIVENFKGDYICGGIGLYGSVNLAILNNIQGESCLINAGSFGKIKILLANKITGKNPITHLAQAPAKIDVLLVNSVEGIGLFNGFLKRDDTPTIDLLVARDLISIESRFVGNLPKNNEPAVNKLLYDNTRDYKKSIISKIHAKQTIYRAETDNISYHKIFSLMDTMEGKTGTELAEIAEKIHKIYEIDIKNV